MLEAVLVLSSVLVFAVIVAGGFALVHLVGRRILVSRKVVINLKSGTAVTGVITSDRAGLLTIKGAEVIEPERNPVPADGEIIVDRDHIDYIQAL